ncbi:MAG: hypothetical protein ABJP34_06085 [Erythrobacter sp.]
MTIEPIFWLIALIQIAFIGYVVFLIARIDRNLTVQTDLLSKIGKLLEQQNRKE